MAFQFICLPPALLLDVVVGQKADGDCYLFLQPVIPGGQCVDESDYLPAQSRNTLVQSDLSIIRATTTTTATTAPRRVGGSFHVPNE